MRLSLHADEQEPISAETFGVNVGLSRGSINVSCRVNKGARVADI
jgi:hypothetical protein